MTGAPELDIDLSRLPLAAVVVDIVYVPLDTPLLVAARRRGNRTVDGLGMLLHQGRPGFEAWFGTPVRVTRELRAAVLTTLMGRDRPAVTAMIVLGLTGSIGMGKSTAAGMLRRLGVRLFDADAVVHRLLGPGGKAVAAVEALFPGVRDETGAIDRRRLGQRVFGDPAALRRLEAILHPMVRQAETRFVGRRGRAAKASSCSTSRSCMRPARLSACDYVLVVSAPARVQRERVMRRPGMTESRFASILRAQMPDREKRRRADFVVPTGLGRGLTFRRLRRVVAELRHGAATPGRAAHRKGGRRCAKS